MNKYNFLDLGEIRVWGEKINLRGNLAMNLFPRDRLIPPIAQTVIFWAVLGAGQTGAQFVPIHHGWTPLL